MGFCKKPGIAGFIIVGFLLTLLVSCGDPVKRHKILTYFFDGVPPFPGEQKIAKTETPIFVSEAVKTSNQQIPPKDVWYVHEPVKDCNSCHKRMKKGEWSVPEFYKSSPAMCYDCHQDYTKTEPFVHGPVAVGDCLFCHTPHRSQNKYLLKEKEPELCYRCHQKLPLMQNPQHVGEAGKSCVSCHKAHTGTTVSLLKADWNQKTN